MTPTARRVLRATTAALAAALTLALPAARPAAAHVTVGGTIKTDTTWGRTSPAADGIYWVTSSVTVNTGATLTIEPGVIVKLGSGTSIVVGGTGGGALAATGTATERIAFTSIKDDLRADTNGDGTATAPAPGDWVRIHFTTGGGGALADVDVLYAGQSSNHAIYCSEGAPAELRNASVRRSRQVGLDCGSGRCPGVVANSTFADNGTWPIRMYPSEASRIAADNEFTGNGNPGVSLAGQTLPAGAHAWAALTVPWFLASTLTVPAGATLDLAAGLVLKLDEGNGITVSGGALNTHGVPGQPVLLTSIRDDAALGDTNADGTATVPARGDWSRVYYSGGGGGALDGVEVRYAGYSSSVAIQCEGGTPSRIAASTLRLNAGTGLYCSTAGQCPASVTGNTFADNSGWPIRIYPSDGPRIAPDNVFVGNRYQGINVLGTSLPAGSCAWAALPVPWYLASTLTLPAGATLDLAAGLVLKFDEGNGINVSGGALNTHGVAGQPVLFTSIRDDAALGDTNGDGTATVPARGNWSRIYYTSGGGGALDGVEVRYAGYASGVAIHCEGGAPSRLAASTVRLTSGLGLHCSTAGQCPASVTGNTFADNSTWPIRLYPPDAPRIAPDNVFLRNGNQGVDVYGTTVPAGTYTWAALAVPWHLTASLTIPAGASVDLAAGVVLKVNAGSSLLVSGGTFSASGTPERKVLVTSEQDDGALGDTNGDGTATTPAPGQWGRVYYTGGGDAGTLAHVEVRHAGYASSVAVHCGTGCFTALTGASIHDNSGTGVRVDWAGTSPAITRSTIRDNTRGIVVTGTASPVIGGAAGQGNDILLNAVYGVENDGARCVNARYNFWGANDGPDDASAADDACDIGSHAGSGDAVSDNVDYTGYVGSPSAPPEPPSPLSPPSPSESATNRPTLTVENSPSPGTLRYRFQVARDAAFSDGLQEQSVDPGAGTTSWTVPSPLRENTTHYWRCRAEDQDGALPSSWTETWRFFVSTVNDPPAAPSPRSPANGSRVETATPALVVGNATDPDDNELHDEPLTYAFEVYADAGLTQLVDGQAAIAEGPAETSWVVATPLAENTEYWWRARARDGAADGAWSATRRFFVNAANDAGPAAPTLFAPSEGAILGTLQPALVVQNPADPDRDPLVFTFEVFTTPGLAGRVASTNAVPGACCSGTTSWTVAPALERSRWHWWTSSARDAELGGPDMAPPGSFFTGGFPLPEPAELGYLPSSGGDTARGDRVGYTAAGQPGDVFVAFEVFDVPAGGEADLRVVVNDADVGTQGPACPGAWSSRRSVLVPDAVFADGTLNRVQFTNARNAPGVPAVEWGVRNVRLDVPPPSGVAARPWDTVVDVSWQPREGVAGFNVYRAAVAGGPYARLNGALVTGHLWRDLGLANGTPYHYVVRSVSETGVEGSDSAEVSATPSTADGVTPVTDLRVARAGDDVRLSWTDVTTTGGTLFYRIYSVGPASAPPFTRSGATVLGTPAGSPFDHVGAATDATATWYDVATVNSGGSEAGW